MKKRSVLIKVIALCLLLTMALPLLASCKSRPIPAGKLAKTPVGVVDGREVLYEELYFVVKSHLPTLQKQYGDDTEALRAALDATVREHILPNYAMLRLCADAGLVYDEENKELNESAQEYVDALIESDFDGKRSNYRDSLSKIGMTDHHLRFNARVDALYAKLPAVYGEQGLLPNTDDEIRNHVKNHFARTWHVAILVEDGESYEENKQKAEEALALLQSGQKTMYDLIGSKYNEDFSLFTTDGYYFPRGAMDKIYEDVAFSLKVNEMSGIVESTGKSNKTGADVTCFYIMERLAIEDAYITAHLNDLADKCADAVVATKLDEVTATLSFTPNDFYHTLDLTSLEEPRDGADLGLILLIGGIVLVVGAATTAVILIVRKKKNRAVVPAKKK